jgi:hypothetical protein
VEIPTLIQGEDVVPAALSVAQATCDILDATEMTSTANEIKNVSTCENADCKISTVASADVSNVVLENMQAIFDSDKRQSSSVGDYLILAAEAGVPQSSVQP